jgi:hypothetical protein
MGVIVFTHVGTLGKGMVLFEVKGLYQEEALVELEGVAVVGK